MIKSMKTIDETYFFCICTMSAGKQQVLNFKYTLISVDVKYKFSNLNLIVRLISSKITPWQENFLASLIALKKFLAMASEQ